MRHKDPSYEVEMKALEHAMKMSEKMKKEAERQRVNQMEELRTYISDSKYGGSPISHGSGTYDPFVGAVAPRPPGMLAGTVLIAKSSPTKWTISGHTEEIAGSVLRTTDGSKLTVNEPSNLLRSSNEVYCSMRGNTFGTFLSKDGRWALTTSLIIEEDLSIAGPSLAASGADITCNTLVVITDLSGDLGGAELSDALASAGSVVCIPTGGHKETIKGIDKAGHKYVGWLFPTHDIEWTGELVMVAGVEEQELHPLRFASKSALTGLLARAHTFLSPSMVRAAKELVAHTKEMEVQR